MQRGPPGRTRRRDPAGLRGANQHGLQEWLVGGRGAGRHQAAERPHLRPLRRRADALLVRSALGTSAGASGSHQAGERDRQLSSALRSAVQRGAWRTVDAAPPGVACAGLVHRQRVLPTAGQQPAFGPGHRAPHARRRARILTAAQAKLPKLVPAPAARREGAHARARQAPAASFDHALSPPGPSAAQQKKPAFRRAPHQAQTPPSVSSASVWRQPPATVRTLAPASASTCFGTSWSLRADGQEGPRRSAPCDTVQDCAVRALGSCTGRGQARQSGCAGSST